MSTRWHTRSLMPHSALASKSTYFWMSTMPLEITLTSRSPTVTTATVTPASSIWSASSLVTVWPASAISSPVLGLATGWASTWPTRRPSRRSFLLYL